MKKNPPLATNKRNWVKNRNVVLRGKPLHYNASQQKKYERRLKQLINVMTTETKKELLKILKNDDVKSHFENQKQIKNIAMDQSASSQMKIMLNVLTRKFNRLFESKANSIAEKFFGNVFTSSSNTLNSSLKQLTGGLSLKTGIITDTTRTIGTKIIEDNVKLIKSIPEKYYADIEKSVMKSLTGGGGIQTIISELEKHEGITERRAKNIALDQTIKAHNQINSAEMDRLGFDQFEWLHSHASLQPRPSHLKMNGHIFSFTNLRQEQEKFGVPEEDQGLPGVPPGCKCSILPVIDFSDK